MPIAELYELIDAAKAGELEEVQEKMDGQNITFTVQNNTATADDIVIMNCTSNHSIEVHTYNVSSSGWNFFIVNRTGGTIAADTDLVYNFLVMQ